MIAYIQIQAFVRPVVIGSNPDRAMEEFNEASPYAVELLAFEQGGEDDLKQFREKFKEFHHRGDWFFYVPSIRNFIRSLP